MCWFALVCRQHSLPDQGLLVVCSSMCCDSCVLRLLLVSPFNTGVYHGQRGNPEEKQQQPTPAHHQDSAHAQDLAPAEGSQNCRVRNHDCNQRELRTVSSWHKDPINTLPKLTKLTDLNKTTPWTFLGKRKWPIWILVLWMRSQHEWTSFGLNSSAPMANIWPEHDECRVLEDYAVVFFGSALFKTLRLFIVAAFSIHFFACIFYRVKVPCHQPRKQ